jgi:hypothetical protein
MLTSMPNGEIAMTNASVPSVNLHHLPRKGNTMIRRPAMRPGQFTLRHTSDFVLSSDINHASQF